MNIYIYVYISILIIAECWLVGWLVDVTPLAREKTSALIFMKISEMISISPIRTRKITGFFLLMAKSISLKYLLLDSEAGGGKTTAFFLPTILTTQNQTEDS